MPQNTNHTQDPENMGHRHDDDATASTADTTGDFGPAIRGAVQESLDTLNPEQHRAATVSGNVMVLAAAGSGKTKTLITRIARLMVFEGVAPEEIMAVTFTNKAAKEMRHRLNSINLGSQGSRLMMGTFHGLCVRFLKAHADAAGLVRTFKIMDSSEQSSFVKRLMKDAEAQQSEAMKEANATTQVEESDICKFINQQKELGLRADHFTPERMEALRWGSKQRNLVFWYGLYEAACRRVCVLDFAELMLACVELFERNPPILAIYQQRLRHILIDEFQDTNALQYRWIKLLAPDALTQKIWAKSGLSGAKVFAVGDDDQSIYRFRGARPENINLFLRDFEATLLKVERNYRSRPYILEAANHLIKNNQNRQGKNLIPVGDKPGKIITFAHNSDSLESQAVAKRIKELRSEDNVPYHEMAVLFRTHNQSRQIEKAMMDQKIPYVIYGGLRFFERQEVKNALAYVTLAMHPDDHMAFLRVVNTPARAIGDKALEILSEVAHTHQVSLMAAINLLGPKDAKVAANFAKFKKVVDQVQAILRNGQPFHVQIGRILVESGLEAMYLRDKERDKDGAIDRLNNLYELSSAARQFAEDQSDRGKDSIDDHEHFDDTNLTPRLDDAEHMAMVEEFLVYTMLDPEMVNDQEADKDSVVKLMTVHASKGLEFDAVFITGMNDGIFPHRNSLNSLAESQVSGNRQAGVDELEEERRLLYVAITRARHHLHMSWSQDRLINGSWQTFPKSRFLAEIPANLKKTLHIF